MSLLKQQEVQLMFARVQPEATQLMERQIEKHYNEEQQAFKLKTTDLFDESKLQTKPFHLVFCLDGSGSMNGKPWGDLTEAYSHLLKTRMGLHAAEDKVSVIIFDHSAQCEFELRPISQAQQHLQQHGGGTAFTPALRQANSILANPAAQGYTPVLIFMSDGQGEHVNNGPMGAMQDIVQTCSGTGLQVFTIAFGRADRQSLSALAQAGGGQMKLAVDGAALWQVFGDIAAGCSALNGLVDQFASKISEMVADKLVLDHM